MTMLPDVLRVLIIEDSVDLRRLLNIFFDGERNRIDSDVSIVFAPDLARGLTELEKFTPHVIVTDLNLPDSTGMDTLDTVLSRAKNIPVIVISGVLDYNYAVEAIRHGADNFLGKDHIGHLFLMIVLTIARAQYRSMTQ